jgi:hypothetical protein
MGAALLLGVLLCLRPAMADTADPTLAAARADVLRQLAAEDDDRLAALMGELKAAVAAGRRGSARIIAGKVDPGADLETAADAAARAAPLALASERADAALDGALPSLAPGLGSLPAGPTSGELVGIEDQLRTAAAASIPFVERRHAAEATLAGMRDALAALKADRPAAALDALEYATAARRTVAAWPSPPTVLPFWLDTTGAMLSAVRRIAIATSEGDVAAAERAGRTYRRAAQDARRADTALALAISESGAAIASTPLGRLADVLGEASARRAAVASVLH